jgi:glycosyltransferase involved in cell wall biosynthesis
MTLNSKPKIAVLLASYNGGAFIGRQIETIASQVGAETHLLISDDGSTDATRSIVESYRDDHRLASVVFSKGPQKGFAENFRSMITKVDDHFDYYAFSDQDDEWIQGKLSRAFEKLSFFNSNMPAIYCGRTEIITDGGDSIGYSPLFKRAPAFRNAIIQSLAGGNTMVLNKAAMRLVKQASARSTFVVHDWFCYFVVTGCGGTVLYDPTPTVRYRQHESNIIGSNNSLSAKLVRISMLFSGRFAEWNSRNLTSLAAIDDLLTDEAKAVVKEFEIARGGGWANRIMSLRKSGIFRQSALGTISLYVACLFKKL